MELLCHGIFFYFDKKAAKKKRDATASSSAEALWIRKKKKSFNLCVACATILDVTVYKISN